MIIFRDGWFGVYNGLEDSAWASASVLTAGSGTGVAEDQRGLTVIPFNWIVFLVELFKKVVMRVSTYFHAAPLIAACVLADANLPPIPEDTTTPVQQRLAVYGPNCMSPTCLKDIC